MSSVDILLVAATFNEIKPITDTFIFIKTKNTSLSTYKKNNVTIDVLITGIGINNTAYWLGNTLGQNKYNLAINAGVAGCFNTNIPLTSVVQVASDMFADFGVDDNETYFTAFEKKLISENEFPFTNAQLFNNSILPYDSIRLLPSVSAITVNTVTGSNQKIKLLTKKFNPDIESMEGAAFFYACLINNIPFLQLRSISNYIEPRNVQKWEMMQAIENLNNQLIILFNQITHCI